MYKPNFSDPRVRRRTSLALGWVYSHTRCGKSRDLYCREIEQNVGRGDVGLGGYLRTHLITVTNSWWSMDTGKTKQYARNETGMQTVVENLGQTYTPDTLWQHTRYWAEYNYADQLRSGVFEYTRGERSNRYNHPLQNVKRESRREIFREYGYVHQYDIESCAPSLLYQLAQKHGCPQLPTVELLLNDRRTFRNDIVQDTGIPVEAIKIMITMMFSGAPQRNQESSAYRSICDDPVALEQFFSHPSIILMKQEIRELWKYIKHAQQIDTSETRRITCKDKWQTYFELETQITGVVKQYLEQHNNKCFLIHDGFYTQQAINTQQLEAEIQEETGYNIKLEAS